MLLLKHVEYNHFLENYYGSFPQSLQSTSEKMEESEKKCHRTLTTHKDCSKGALPSELQPYLSRRGWFPILDNVATFATPLVKQDVQIVSLGMSDILQTNDISVHHLYHRNSFHLFPHQPSPAPFSNMALLIYDETRGSQ